MPPAPEPMVQALRSLFAQAQLARVRLARVRLARVRLARVRLARVQLVCLMAEPVMTPSCTV